MRHLWVLIVAAVLLSVAPAQSAVHVGGISTTLVASSLVTFSDESSAQQHCPSDRVVWLNLPTMIYHLRDERWYGRTHHGAYVCEREAIAAGARMTRNGQ